ncbi:MAG TPA: hypothetical protein VNG51_25520 [Ktedonobacteraceae bacterium]|nr:hypothetical protein [Ktedonobacteraceae bacterium]
MRNASTFYALIGIGIIALIVGIYFMATNQHHTLGPAGIVVGIILVLAGAVGMFVVRPRR